MVDFCGFNVIVVDVLQLHIMNEHQYQQHLRRTAYINVTGLTCLSYGQESMRFRIPSITDYPGQRHISGKDFIFLILDNGQTWFKRVDLDNGGMRIHLQYTDPDTGRVITMDGRNPENSHGTVLAYPFEFEDGELEMRKLDPDCVILEKSNHVISPAAIMNIISSTITQSVENFIYRLITGRNNKELKQFPNKPFLEAFNSTLKQENPLPDDHLRNFYMMVIFQAQIEGKFPYNLSHNKFVALVEVPQPPMRFKEEIGTSAVS